MFSTLLKNLPSFISNFKLSSTNSNLEESKFVIWERVKWHEHYDNHEKMLSYSNKKKVWVSSSSIVQVLTLSQTTNSRLFQIETVCRRQFQIPWKWQNVPPKKYKTLWEKEKLLVTSNFSFSYSVFERLVLRTRKNQGLFGKGLKELDQNTADRNFSIRKIYEDSDGKAVIIC